jgi:hypothetical protein
VPGFEQYFRQLHIHNNTRNVWFHEYWQRKFSCKYQLYEPFGKDNRNTTEFNTMCQLHQQSLADVPYNEDPKLAFVINSILAVVHGLDKMHKQVYFFRWHECYSRLSLVHYRFVMAQLAYAQKWHE